MTTTCVSALALSATSLIASNPGTASCWIVRCLASGSAPRHTRRARPVDRGDRRVDPVRLDEEPQARASGWQVALVLEALLALLLFGEQRVGVGPEQPAGEGASREVPRRETPIRLGERNPVPEERVLVHHRRIRRARRG